MAETIKNGDWFENITQHRAIFFCVVDAEKNEYVFFNINKKRCFIGHRRNFKPLSAIKYITDEGRRHFLSMIFKTASIGYVDNDDNDYYDLNLIKKVLEEI